MSTAAVLSEVTLPVAPARHGFFRKLMDEVDLIFHVTPSWVEGINGLLQLAIPVVQLFVGLDLPELAPEINPVLSRLKVGMATLSLMAKQGGTHPTLLSTLQSVQANVAQLESVAHVTDPATQAKISTNLDLLTSELAAVEAMISPAPVSSTP